MATIGRLVGMPRIAKPRRPLQKTYLREWRDFRGLTQEQAAERLDISRTQLSRIESGKQPYNQGFIEAAAEAYGCTVPDLIVRDPTNASAVWSIADQLKKADPATRKRVQEVVETLLKTG